MDVQWCACAVRMLFPSGRGPQTPSGLLCGGAKEDVWSAINATVLPPVDVDGLTPVSRPRPVVRYRPRTQYAHGRSTCGSAIGLTNRKSPPSYVQIQNLSHLINAKNCSSKSENQRSNSFDYLELTRQDKQVKVQIKKKNRRVREESPMQHPVLII